ncbi:MAG: type IV pilin protein [Gammaproteobacteria bacterium]|nr:type IV pilin protein [Gammaproteobacteria bacterium]
MKKNNGFTLIELMIVVVIIGILTAVAAPSYMDYLRESRRADAKVGLTKLADKQERYYLQNNIYATTLANLNITSSASDEGLYTLSITSADVSGFVVTATAVASGPQANDTGCTVMTLSSTSARGSGGSVTADSNNCW